MIRLIGKTQWDSSAIEGLGAGRNYAAPFSVFHADESVHSFWTLAMPMSEPLLREFTRSYRTAIHYDHQFLVVTSNTDGWHEVAQKMSASHDKAIRQFVAVLIQTFPEIFKDLNRRVRVDGTMAIMKYSGN